MKKKIIIKRPAADKAALAVKRQGAFQRVVTGAANQKRSHFPTPWKYETVLSMNQYASTIYDALGVPIAADLTDGNAAMIVHAVNLHHDLTMALRNVLDPIRPDDKIEGDVDHATDILLKAVRGPC